MHCGVGDYTAQLADALRRRRDIELVVLTSVAEAPFTPPFVRRRVERWRAHGPDAFVDMVATFRPDVVHVQYPAQGYESWSAVPAISVLARRRSNAGVVQTWHEYPQPLSTPAGWALMVMGGEADQLVYVRPDYEQHVRGALRRVIAGVPRHFVPNGAALPSVALSRAERERIRTELAVGERRVLAYFGFAFPHKGVHHLFTIANPATDHLVFIGDLQEADPYHSELLALARSAPWQGRVTICGYVDAERAARILGTADAAVFPFEDGGGVWNSSVHAAMAQGTFTLVTSRERNGYVAAENAYYAAPASIPEMRSALDTYAGRRHAAGLAPSWDAIAERHVEIYRRALQAR
jgi:glycosyltransferase involved in cell wall biosynthesis